VATAPGKRGGGLRKAIPKRAVEDSAMTKLDQCKAQGSAHEMFNANVEANGQECNAVGGKNHATFESQKSEMCIEMHSDLIDALADPANAGAGAIGSLPSKGEFTLEATEESATVMIRHIACRYTKKDVESFLDSVGLNGKYKWVYLPMNPKKSANLGYVFVNFLSQSGVDECRYLLDNQVFGDSQSLKRCQVSMAYLQGARSVQKSNRKAKMVEKNQAERKVLQITHNEKDKAFLDLAAADTRKLSTLDIAGCTMNVVATGTGKGKGSSGTS
jgi:hypothetical protein